MRAMTEEELRKTLAGLDKLTTELVASPKMAKDFWVKHGFIAPDGELTENYK